MDRLRRLDALFAEKVLGLPCSWYGCVYIPLSPCPAPVLLDAQTYNDWPTAEQERERLGYGHIAETRQRELLFVGDYSGLVIGPPSEAYVPNYTRSLDAVWPALEQYWVSNCRLTPITMTINTIGDYVGAGFGKESDFLLNGRHEPYGGAERPHMAEALVIMVLRHAGYTTQEIP